MTIPRPNVDYKKVGFWPYQVYGPKGWIHSDRSILKNKNIRPNNDGSISMFFGTKVACGTDRDRTDKQDEDFSITNRIYNPLGKIPPDFLNPKLEKVKKQNLAGPLRSRLSGPFLAPVRACPRASCGDALVRIRHRQEQGSVEAKPGASKYSRVSFSPETLELALRYRPDRIFQRAISNAHRPSRVRLRSKTGGR